MATSPFALLGCPNLPAAKKDTDVPLAGTSTEILAEKLPLAPDRKTTVPPPDFAFALI
jgi:hypothetical protein